MPNYVLYIGDCGDLTAADPSTPFLALREMSLLNKLPPRHIFFSGQSTVQISCVYWRKQRNATGRFARGVSSTGLSAFQLPKLMVPQLCDGLSLGLLTPQSPFRSVRQARFATETVSISSYILLQGTGTFRLGWHGACAIDQGKSCVG